MDYRGTKFVGLSFFACGSVLIFACSTVAVALWAMEENVTMSPNLQQVVDGVYEGGVGNVVTKIPVDGRVVA